MDPLTMIVTAVVTGAATAATEVASHAVKDGYGAIKRLIINRFGQQSSVEAALNGVENNPDSQVWQATLKEELANIKANQNQELVKEAQKLLELLQEEGVTSDPSYQATVFGDGAIAQGEGATAAGRGGIAVGGNVEGGINLGGERSDKA